MNIKNKKTLVMLILILSLVSIIVVGVILAVVLTSKSNRQKSDPVVSVSVAESTYVEGMTLENISLILENGGTAGTVSWIDSTYVLVVGSNQCQWKFVPEDADKFNEKTGTIEIEAESAVVSEIAVKTNPTKLSGYQAFDEFDASGLVLNATYNNGKVYEISSGFGIEYQVSEQNVGETEKSLRAGDTKVTITYGGQKVDIDIETVKKIGLEKVEVLGTYVYDGMQKQAQIAQSQLYNVSNDTYTNAGFHEVLVTLSDFQNYEWIGSTESATISVRFEIQKAEIDVTENNYNAAFDGDSHKVSVTSSQADKIYYSTDELDENNYLIVGSEDEFEFEGITNSTVYYYIKAIENYKNKAGSLSVIISKAMPSISVRDVMTIASGDVVEANVSQVEAVGVNGEKLSLDSKISFEYYISYESESVNEKTTTQNAGSREEGGAPANVGIYYVVAIYAGNENYSSAKSDAFEFVIDAKFSELFAEVNALNYKNVAGDYFEIIKNNETSPVTLTFYSNLYESVEIEYEDGKYVFKDSESEQKYFILFGENEETLKVVDADDEESFVEFAKVNLYDIIGTYECDLGYGEDNINSLVIYYRQGEYRYSIDYLYENPVLIEGHLEGIANYSEQDYGSGEFDIEFEGKPSFWGVWVPYEDTMYVSGLRGLAQECFYIKVS